MATQTTLITPLRLAESLMKTITGYSFRKPEIININDTREEGDLSFSIDLEEWEDYVNTDEPWYHQVQNILDYYKFRALLYPNSEQWNDTLILQILKNSALGEYNRIFDCHIEELNSTMDLMLIGTNVRVFFYPAVVTHYTVKCALESGASFGQKLSNNKEFKFIIDDDAESEVTSLRLHLLRKVTENILLMEGYGVRRDSNSCDNNFIFTTKKSDESAGNFNKYVCGAACRALNSKLTYMSKDEYVDSVTNRTRSLWRQEYPSMYINVICADADLVKTAFAAIYYELLCIRFSDEVVIRLLDENDHIKEASFCLFINVKLAMTIDIYSKFLCSKLPLLISIESMKFFHCANHFPTWYMIYNYIMRFPDVTDYAVSAQTKLEVNIQLLWTFTINLCRDFNKYSIQESILTNRNEVSVDVIEAMEKLYIFMALRTVLKKAFTLLEVQEVVYLC